MWGLRPRNEIKRSGSFWSTLGVGVQGFGTHSSYGDQQALSLPAFYSGVKLRSDRISGFPLRVVDAAGKPTGLEVPIIEQPDPTEDRQITVARIATSLTMRGEFLAILGDWEDGLPNALKVVDPACAQRDQFTLEWSIEGRIYARDEVLWFPRLILPQEIRGISTVELFRRLICGQISAQQFQESFYTAGGLPPALLKIKRDDVTPTQLDDYMAAWRNKMAGPREPVSVPDFVDLEVIDLSNQDMQWIESRQFSLLDVAQMVGVPPYYVGFEGSKNTYTNLQDVRRQLVEEYLSADLTGIERQFSRLLPQGLFAKFDYSAFLELDPIKKAQSIQARGAWTTVNEARIADGLEPFPPDDPRGDVLLAASAPGASVAPQDVDSDPTNDTAVVEGRDDERTDPSDV